MVTDDTALIDQSLRLIASQVYRFRRFLLGSPPAALSSLAELRAGPIGQSLIWLTRVAAGEERADLPAVSQAVRSILDLLFWPMGADTYDIAQSFWDEPLGAMLARAKWGCANPQDLISIGEAADYLGVTRPTIYRWMATGQVESVRDERTGRFYLLASEVTRLRWNVRQVAAEREALLTDGLVRMAEAREG